MKKHVKVAAGLVFEKGRIFATKRGESPYSYLAHKYEFPGGKLEPGESGPDTVKRELKEELSLDVKVGGLFAATTFEYPDFIVTLSVYECEMLSDFVLNGMGSCRCGHDRNAETGVRRIGKTIFKGLLWIISF